MNLKEKCAEAEQTAAQLECSLAIQKMVPLAFADGKATIRWSSTYPHSRREDYYATVIDSNGNETRLSATEISDCLWNDRPTNRIN